jgi:hypothetical protein
MLRLINGKMMAIGCKVPLGYYWVGNKKTRPIKPKKKPPQSDFLGFNGVMGFFKTDICFWCKSHYFSYKMSLEKSYLGYRYW